MQCVLSHKHQKCSGIILLHSFVCLFLWTLHLVPFFVLIFLSKQNLVPFFFSFSPLRQNPFLTKCPNCTWSSSLPQRTSSQLGSRPQTSPGPQQFWYCSFFFMSFPLFFFAFYKMITIWQETQTRYEEQGKHDWHFCLIDNFLWREYLQCFTLPLDFSGKLSKDHLHLFTWTEMTPWGKFFAEAGK